LVVGQRYPILHIRYAEKLANTLNLSYFISKRISEGRQSGFSATIHTIAVMSIAIGLLAAVISFLIMKGFQETVKNKIYGFSGHLLITKFSMNNSPEEKPMNFHVDVYDNRKEYPFIKHIQEFAHKAGLVKTKDEVLGVVVKGVGKSFDVKSFQESIIEGKFIDLPDSGYGNQVIISKTISDKINAKVGDAITVHFFQNPPRARKLKVSGIYETNLSEYFDSRVIITDIRMIRRLNDWPDSLAGGLEVFLDYNFFNGSQLRFTRSGKINEEFDDEGNLQSSGGVVHNIVNFDFESAVVDESIERIGESMDYDLNIEKVSDKYLQVFEWLQLLSRQVNIILFIILFVIFLNMISIVFLLVMERTQMIGLLKALGAGNKTVRRVFIYNGMLLMCKGLVIGNIIGIGICFIQDKFKVIKLNAHDYYMSFVPISWHWDIIILLNVVTFLVVALALLIPTIVISRINPIKAIRFD
jgi:lipoprotein-releasing system permease protein